MNLEEKLEYLENEYVEILEKIYSLEDDLQNDNITQEEHDELDEEFYDELDEISNKIADIEEEIETQIKL